MSVYAYLKLPKIQSRLKTFSFLMVIRNQLFFSTSLKYKSYPIDKSVLLQHFCSCHNYTSFWCTAKNSNLSQKLFLYFYFLHLQALKKVWNKTCPLPLALTPCMPNIDLHRLSCNSFIIENIIDQHVKFYTDSPKR